MARKVKIKPLTAEEAKNLGYQPMQFKELQRLCMVNSDKIPKAFIIGDINTVLGKVSV